MPVTFWVLPEDYEKGFEVVKQTKLYLRFLEEYLGPYPFRAEKVGIIHTKHLGMEHQTIIAYGSFSNSMNLVLTGSCCTSSVMSGGRIWPRATGATSGFTRAFKVSWIRFTSRK